MEKIITPAIYVNAERKEFVVFQDKRTSAYTIDTNKERRNLIDNGFVFMTRISGDASVLINGVGSFKQLKRGEFKPTKPTKSTKADALAYAEALVVILKRLELDKE